jgi:hypothetical protein
MARAHVRAQAADFNLAKERPMRLHPDFATQQYRPEPVPIPDLDEDLEDFAVDLLMHQPANREVRLWEDETC